MPPVSTTYYPSETPVVEVKSGIITPPWDHFFAALSSLAVTVNGIPGQNLFAFAAQPSLGVSDAGYIGWVTDYGHFVRWTGTIWELAPGDVGIGFYRHFGVAPQEVGWQLCDGTVTDYLTVGAATLTATAFTTPDAVSSPLYLKSAAVAAIAIVAASGATFSGTTGAEVDTHAANFGADFAAAAHPHDHSFSGTTNADMDVRHLNTRLYFRR